MITLPDSLDRVIKTNNYHILGSRDFILFFCNIFLFGKKEHFHNSTLFQLLKLAKNGTLF